MIFISIENLGAQRRTTPRNQIRTAHDWSEICTRGKATHHDEGAKVGRRKEKKLNGRLARLVTLKHEI